MKQRCAPWPLPPSCVSQEVETELATLIKLLAPVHDGEWIPVVDEIKVVSGYEQALGAALGDDLDAADNETAPAHWRFAAARAGDPALPEGATPLSQFVQAPKVLARRLAQIGVVAAERRRDLQTELAPGQRLVSREGDLWRWDGYSIRSGAASAAGARLVERSRLEALKDERAEAEALQAPPRRNSLRPRAKPRCRAEDQVSSPQGQRGARRA